MDPQAELSKQSPLRWLAGREYPARRSPTLIENPQAKLNPKEEISRYLDSLEPSYLDRLKAMNAQIGQPMSENCRLSIGIPAYAEGSNIGKTLELYTKQKDKDGNLLDPNLFEIVIFDNHPTTTSKDSTQRVVEEFKKAHPNLKIIYAHKEWGAEDPATVGNARKHLSDLTLLRISQRQRNSEELILVSNDADAEKIDDNYIADIIEAFDRNPKTEALTASFSWPDEAMQKPNLLAAGHFWSFLSRLSETGAVGDPSQRQKEPVVLTGRNAAVKSSIYAAVGGYNPNAKNAEDVEMGWLVADARSWDPQSVIYLNKAKIISNPRRHLSALATKIPLNEMYMDFHSKPEIRNADNEQLLRMVPDDLDLSLLEREADGWWQSRNRGEFKFLGSKFEPTYKRAMNFLGLEFQIIDGHVKITNAEKLLAGLSKRLGRQEKINPQGHIENTNNVNDEEKVEAYVSEFTQGFDEVRSAKAKEYADRLAAIQQGAELVEGDRNKLEFLKKEYKRFTNLDYDIQKNTNSSNLEDAKS